MWKWAGKWNWESSIWDSFQRHQATFKVCAWNWNLSFCTAMNLKIDFLILPSSQQPYWSINRQDIRLKSSPISLWSLIGAEGQEMCVFLYWFIAFMDPTRAVNVYVCKLWNNSPLVSCCLFPFQNLLFLFFFLWYPQNKFKCLLSSSNQTAGDILEKKWNKMLCD